MPWKKKRTRILSPAPVPPLGGGVYCPRSAQGWWSGVEVRAAPLFAKLTMFSSHFSLLADSADSFIIVKYCFIIVKFCHRDIIKPG